MTDLSAYMCPYAGCGRSFSVQSNMRRHARVHIREAAAYYANNPPEDDSDGAESEAHSVDSRQSHHSRDNGSSESHSSRR